MKENRNRTEACRLGMGMAGRPASDLSALGKTTPGATTRPTKTSGQSPFHGPFYGASLGSWHVRIPREYSPSTSDHSLNTSWTFQQTAPSRRVSKHKSETSQRLREGSQRTTGHLTSFPGYAFLRTLSTGALQYGHGGWPIPLYAAIKLSWHSPESAKERLVRSEHQAIHSQQDTG